MNIIPNDAPSRDFLQGHGIAHGILHGIAHGIMVSNQKRVGLDEIQG